MSDTHTIDIQTTLYFSKEEIAEKTGISPHTLQNWINADKPTDVEFETLRGGKRTYSTIYIEKIFKHANRAELLPKLRPQESPTTGQVEVNHQSGISQPMPKQWSSTGQAQTTPSEEKSFNNEVIELVNQKWEASVAGKEEVITLLKEQLESTKIQMELKDSQIADLSRNLNQQQVLQMETVKEVARLREENNKLLLLSQEPVVDQPLEETPPAPEIGSETNVEEQAPVRKKGFFARIFS